jgi:hypothetical protein
MRRCTCLYKFKEINVVKIAIVSTVRAPIEDLRHYVHYHLNIGIDEIILFFDDPLDEGVDAFAQYSNVTSIACSASYWNANGERPGFIGARQTVNVNNGAKMAAEKQCDWLIHIDNDELINPLVDMNQVLANTNEEAVRFTLLEAVSEQGCCEHLFMPQLFKKQSTKRSIQIAKLLGCSKAFFENRYFRGHGASKMAVRITPEIKQYGIHTAKKHHGMLAVKNSEQLQLLHFDCIDFGTWNRKWMRHVDGTGISNSLGNHRQKQLALYRQARGEGHKELFALYKRLYHLPKKQQIVLQLLGMLSTVKIDPDLFEYRHS